MTTPPQNNSSISSTDEPQTKYIIVSGGVISGIGKGVIASSTGLLLRTLGFKVTSIKIDPYLNIDAGTMTPLDHGRVSLCLFRLFGRFTQRTKDFLS